MPSNKEKFIKIVVLVFALIGIIYSQYISGFKPNDLKKINGHINGKPTFDLDSEDPSIYISLKEFKSIHFVTNDYSFKVSKKNKIKQILDDGSYVTIFVRNNSVLNFLSTLINQNTTEIIGLKDKKNTYISVHDYNQYGKEDYVFFYFLWIILSFSFFTKFKKEKSSN